MPNCRGNTQQTSSNHPILLRVGAQTDATQDLGRPFVHNGMGGGGWLPRACSYKAPIINAWLHAVLISYSASLSERPIAQPADICPD